MKRKNYQVKISNGQQFTKHTWNAARNEIVKCMRVFATEWDCEFREHQTAREKDSRNNHIYGVFNWVNDKGQFFEFTIELVD